jgi:hypothetical protein
MPTKSKIALSFAVILGATSVSLTTHAFAQNGTLDRGRSELNSKNGKTEKLQMKPDERWNDLRGERSNELGPRPRWIDAASPGG